MEGRTIDVRTGVGVEAILKELAQYWGVQSEAKKQEKEINRKLNICMNIK